MSQPNGHELTRRGHLAESGCYRRPKPLASASRDFR